MLEVWRSKSVFANSSIHYCHKPKTFLNVIMAVGLRYSKICRGQRSEGSGHNEVNYNLLKCNLYAIELECILNGLPWHRFAVCTAQIFMLIVIRRFTVWCYVVKLWRFVELQPNCQVTSLNGLPKRATSCDVKLIVMEEFAPMRTPLRSGICLCSYIFVHCYWKYSTRL